MQNLSKLMNRAWQIARSGAEIFGGKSKLYFSSSLRIAWVESRDIPLPPVKHGLSVWKPGHGNHFLLPGIPLPVIEDDKGSILLPGIAK